MIGKLYTRLLRYQEERSVVLTKSGVAHNTYAKGKISAVEFDFKKVLALPNVWMFYHNHPYYSGCERSTMDLGVCASWYVTLGKPFFYTITDFKNIKVWQIYGLNESELILHTPYYPYRSLNRYRMNFKKLKAEVEK